MHKSSIKKLVTVLQEQDEAGLNQSLELILRGYVDQYLLIAKKEPAVERVIKFFCDFLAATSLFDSDTIFLTGMDHLLKRSLATDKNVRYRACQSLAFVINNMSVDAVVSDALWEGVTATLTPRLKDKAPNVRMCAIKALKNLQCQNGEDTNDPLMLEFIRLMDSDTAAAVRVCAVDNVEMTKLSLVSLVARVRDTKPEVRIAALERLANAVDVRHMSASQRATVATFGLGDRDTACHNVAVGLVQKWATSLDNRVPKLLQLMGMTRVQNASAVELVGNALIDIVENAGNNPFPASHGLKSAVRDDKPKWDGEVGQLSASEILWAQLRCEYARKNFAPAAAEEIMSHLVPDMVVICTQLAAAHSREELTTKDSLKLSMKSLLKMTKFLDAADVSGGQELTKVCETMLVDIQLPEELVEAVLDAWLRGLGKADNATIMQSITLLSEKFGQILENEDSTASEFDEETLEVLAATRGLQLVSWALRKGTNGSDNNQQLSTTFYQFAIDSLQSTSPDMRRLAVECIGMMSLSSKDLCTCNRDILVQVAAQDLEEVEVRDQALKAIVDVATVHPSLFENDIMVSNLLCRIMRDTDGVFTSPSLRLNAVESAAKLLFSRTLNDPRLFSMVLQIFFIPSLLGATGNDGADEETESSSENAEKMDRLQQFLNIFFQSFASVHANGNANGDSADTHGIVITSECIADLFADMLLLCRDNKAPVSVLTKVTSHVLNMHETFRGSSSSSSTDNTGSVQARIAASISREALKLGNSKIEKAIVKELVKVLATLTPETWGATINAAHLTSCAIKSAKCINHSCTMDKTTTTSLKGFIASCAKAMKAANATSGACDAADAAEDSEEILDDAEAYVRYQAQLEAEAAKETFYTFAPGLFDLVELIAVDDSDIDSGEGEGDSDDESEMVASPPAPPAASEAEPLTDLAGNGEVEAPVVPKTTRAKKTSTASITKKATKAAPKTTTTKAKTTKKAKEEEDEDGKEEPEEEVTSHSRRARTTRKVVEAAVTDEEEVDMENHNPQAL